MNMCRSVAKTYVVLVDVVRHDATQLQHFYELEDGHVVLDTSCTSGTHTLGHLRTVTATR